MTINADLHTHTVFSHGKNTPEEMVLSAIRKGLKKIAITDHAPSHIFYGVRNVPKYLEAIHRARDKYADQIEVLAGMEFNIVSLNGRMEACDQYLDKLDIVLIGYHKAVRYLDLQSAAHFYLRKGGKNGVGRNTLSYIRAMERNRIDILAHPGYGIPIDHKMLAMACVKNKVAVEVNASHHDLTADELLVYINAGVMFAVNSDAHKKQKMGEFGTVPEWLSQLGVGPERVVNACP